MFQEQKNSVVFIKSAIKNSRKKNPKEILVYEEETPIVEETAEVAEEKAEEPALENDAAETLESENK